MNEGILPPDLRPYCDRWSARVVEFYGAWVRSGCPDSHEQKMDDSTKMLVRINRETNQPVLMFSIQEWRPFEQRRCWTLAKDYGAVARHPTDWFIEVVEGLKDAKKEDDQ